MSKFPCVRYHITFKYTAHKELNRFLSLYTTYAIYWESIVDEKIANFTMLDTFVKIFSHHDKNKTFSIVAL